MGSFAAPPPPPPHGQIPESLVRDILTLIKKEYPWADWAETLLTSKMSKEQINVILDRPYLKQIIMSIMARMPGASNQMYMHNQLSAAVAGAASASSVGSGSAAAGQWRQSRRVPMKFVEFLYQIKKIAEVGILDESLLDEPLSPMTMTMLYSVVEQVKVRGVGKESSK